MENKKQDIINKEVNSVIVGDNGVYENDKKYMILLAQECAIELGEVLSKYHQKTHKGFFISILRNDVSYGLKFGDIYNLIVSDFTKTNTNGVLKLT